MSTPDAGTGDPSMTGIFSWLGPAITVVMFLGAASVYLLGSRDKATIAQLKENNLSLNESVDILERETAKQKAQITALEQANSVLSRTVTAADKIAELKAEIVSLSNRLAIHHKEAMTAWTQIHRDLQAIKEATAGSPPSRRT